MVSGAVIVGGCEYSVALVVEGAVTVAWIWLREGLFCKAADLSARARNLSVLVGSRLPWPWRFEI